MAIHRVEEFCGWIKETDPLTYRPTIINFDNSAHETGVRGVYGNPQHRGVACVRLLAQETVG